MSAPQNLDSLQEPLIENLSEPFIPGILNSQLIASDSSVKKGQGDEIKDPDLEGQQLLIRDTAVMNEMYSSTDRQKSFIENVS
jgi:hypothetical protein